MVFLDFDGVLNSIESHERDGRRGGPYGLYREHVEHLNEIVRLSGATVVVSSTWRLGYTVPALRKLLRGAGYLGSVIGKTPDLQWVGDAGHIYRSVPRGHEIASWRAKNNHVGPFVILDDDSDMAELSDRLVKTEFRTGLVAEHVSKAYALLQEAS